MSTFFISEFSITENRDCYLSDNSLRNTQNQYKTYLEDKEIEVHVITMPEANTIQNPIIFSTLPAR